MVLVQWHGGRKVIIAPEGAGDSGALELPSGWRLILGSLQWIRLKRRNEESDEQDASDEEG